MFSYRALVGQRLEEHYTQAPFTFWDAALGGTRSDLAAFRLQRDVIAHHPDLVFIDFTVNDNPYAVDDENLAAYESLTRRILLETGAPVVLAIFLGSGQPTGDFPGQRGRDLLSICANGRQRAHGQVLATNLDPTVTHILEIIPQLEHVVPHFTLNGKQPPLAVTPLEQVLHIEYDQVVRIESICIAGGPATIERVP